jgi:hypothetical protein
MGGTAGRASGGPPRKLSLFKMRSQKLSAYEPVVVTAYSMKQHTIWSRQDGVLLASSSPAPPAGVP